MGVLKAISSALFVRLRRSQNDNQSLVVDATHADHIII
jgi:hypothetical protein